MNGNCERDLHINNKICLSSTILCQFQRGRPLVRSFVTIWNILSSRHHCKTLDNMESIALMELKGAPENDSRLFHANFLELSGTAFSSVMFLKLFCHSNCGSNQRRTICILNTMHMRMTQNSNTT